jgi:TolB-like protein
MKTLMRLILPALALLTAGAALAADMHQELDDITRRLATKIEASQKKNVAVADFTDLEGQVRQLGRFVSEEVSTNLVLASQKFSVIDRNHLRTILKEQKLSMSGLMDPENQKKLGKILGVDALVLGSITPFGESYRVTFKVVATDTAQVVVADRGSIPKTPATDELWATTVPDELSPGASQPVKTGEVPMGSIQGVFKAGNVSIQVDRIVPLDNGQYRVVGTATNGTDKPLKVMLLAPTELMDLMGNVAQVRSSTGILPCMNGSRFWKDEGYCERNEGQDYTDLLPGKPQRFAINFEVVGDKQTMGAEVQLNGRMLIKGEKPVAITFNFLTLKVSKP